MRQIRKIHLSTLIINAILLLILVTPKAHSQVPGQPADKDQTTTVLKQLIDGDLIGLGILMGKETAPGTFGLVFWDDEKCGSVSARCVGDKIWLESLVLTPQAAILRPSLDENFLRAKLYKFFGGDVWHEGTKTKSVDRQDVWVQRSTRLDNGLVIQYSFGNWYPTLLFDLKVINWPTPTP